MRVEISEEQYKALKCSDVELEVRKQYFLITNKKGRTTKHRSPLDLIQVSAREGIEFASPQQKVAYVNAVSILGTDYMASGELGEKLSKELKCTRDMGSYYVGELIKAGGLEITSD